MDCDFWRAFVCSDYEIGENMIQLYQGDCLEEMKKIADHSVDMIFTDLPYGTTRNAWDKRIPLAPLWEQYKRVLKSGG